MPHYRFVSRLLAPALTFTLAISGVGAADSQTIPLQNRDIIGLVRAGISPNLIINRIKESQNQFDLSDQAFIDLKEAGVTDDVLAAMTGVSTRNQGVVAAPLSLPPLGAKGFSAPPADPLSSLPPLNDTFAPPPANSFAPPPLNNLATPPANSFAAPPANSFATPPADAFAPPPGDPFAPPPQNTFSPPPLTANSPGLNPGLAGPGPGNSPAIGAGLGISTGPGPAPQNAGAAGFGAPPAAGGPPAAGAASGPGPNAGSGLNSERFMSELANIAGGSPDGKRTGIAWMLANRNLTAAPLRQAITANQPDVQAAALQALSAMDDKDSIPVIRELLANPSPLVRQQAAAALVAMDDREAVAVAEKALSRPIDPLDGFIRVVGYARVIRASADLGTLLAKSTVALNRSAAAWALAEIGRPAAIAFPALENALARDSDSNVRRDAARAIAVMHEPTSARLLQAACRKDPQVRKIILQALSEYPESAEFLVGVMNLGPEQIAADELEAARASLAQLTGVDFALDGNRWSQWFALNKSRFAAIAPAAQPAISRPPPTPFPAAGAYPPPADNRVAASGAAAGTGAKGGQVDVAAWGIVADPTQIPMAPEVDDTRRRPGLIPPGGYGRDDSGPMSLSASDFGAGGAPAGPAAAGPAAGGGGPAAAAGGMFPPRGGAGAGGSGLALPPSGAGLAGSGSMRPGGAGASGGSSFAGPVGSLANPLARVPAPAPASPMPDPLASSSGAGSYDPPVTLSSPAFDSSSSSVYDSVPGSYDSGFSGSYDYSSPSPYSSGDSSSYATGDLLGDSSYSSSYGSSYGSTYGDSYSSYSEPVLTPLPRTYEPPISLDAYTKTDHVADVVAASGVSGTAEGVSPTVGDFRAPTLTDMGITESSFPAPPSLEATYAAALESGSITINPSLVATSPQAVILPDNSPRVVDSGVNAAATAGSAASASASSATGSLLGGGSLDSAALSGSDFDDFDADDRASVATPMPAVPMPAAPVASMSGGLRPPGTALPLPPAAASSTQTLVQAPIGGLVAATAAPIPVPASEVLEMVNPPATAGILPEPPMASQAFRVSPGTGTVEELSFPGDDDRFGVGEPYMNDFPAGAAGTAAPATPVTDRIVERLPRPGSAGAENPPAGIDTELEDVRTGARGPRRGATAAGESRPHMIEEEPIGAGKNRAKPAVTAFGDGDDADSGISGNRTGSAIISSTSGQSIAPGAVSAGAVSAGKIGAVVEADRILPPAAPPVASPVASSPAVVTAMPVVTATPVVTRTPVVTGTPVATPAAAAATPSVPFGVSGLDEIPSLPSGGFVLPEDLAKDSEDMFADDFFTSPGAAIPPVAMPPAQTTAVRSPALPPPAAAATEASSLKSILTGDLDANTEEYEDGDYEEGSEGSEGEDYDAPAAGGSGADFGAAPDASFGGATGIPPTVTDDFPALGDAFVEAEPYGSGKLPAAQVVVPESHVPAPAAGSGSGSEGAGPLRLQLPPF